MKHRELKVARIGNSRGVRLPAEVLKRYRISERVVMEERADGILLRPRGGADAKLSWRDTALAMATAAEGWIEWDGVASDGLDALPWEGSRSRRVAEAKARYVAKKKR